MFTWDPKLILSIGNRKHNKGQRHLRPTAVSVWHIDYSSRQAGLQINTGRKREACVGGWKSAINLQQIYGAILCSFIIQSEKGTVALEACLSNKFLCVGQRCARRLRAWREGLEGELGAFAIPYGIGQSTPLIIRLIDCFIAITYKKVMQFRYLVSQKLVYQLANMERTGFIFREHCRAMPRTLATQPWPMLIPRSGFVF